LTAETVILPLEDAADYKAFELAVTSNYDAETAVERELVLRLASLLWRLRRATSIETGLFHIQREQPPSPSEERSLLAVLGSSHPATEITSNENSRYDSGRKAVQEASDDCETTPALMTCAVGFDIARRFDASCASRTSTTVCSSAWAVTKRLFGVKSDRRSLRLNDCAGERQAHALHVAIHGLPFRLKVIRRVVAELHPYGVYSINVYVFEGSTPAFN
jgi:hypothetical protein